LKKIIKEIFFNNIGLTCNFAELIYIPYSSFAVMLCLMVSSGCTLMPKGMAA